MNNSVVKELDNTTAAVESFKPLYIIHPQNKKPCIAMGRKTGESNRFGEEMWEVILPYSPTERLFGRRKQTQVKRGTYVRSKPKNPEQKKPVFKKLHSSKHTPKPQNAHTLIMSASKLRNLSLSKQEKETLLKKGVFHG